MTTLFGRRVELQIQRRGAPESRTLSGLRVVGRTKRSVTETPDASQLTVFGAAEQSLRDLQQPGTVVRVLAGYGDQLAVVLAGSVRPGTLQILRQSGESTASMEVVDSRVAVRAAAVARAWDQTTSSEVTSWAIDAAGLSRGSIEFGSDVQYVRGFVASGVVADVLARVAKDSGSTLVIQDGIVSMFPVGQQRRASSLIFSPTSGMVGSPRRADEGRVEVQSLLAPSIRPGDGYRVEAADLAGDYVAHDVEHEFDSWDGPFYTRVVGTRIR